MNLVCLDTQYFIWGVLQQSRPSQVEQIAPAVEFFRWLDENNSTIIVPTPLVTELLMGAEPDERAKILSVLEGEFSVREFDMLSAKNAADIWNLKKRAGVIEELVKQGKSKGDLSVRSKIKIDTQILAIAMAAGATVLYTNDEELKTLADGFIPARKIPMQAQANFLAKLDAPPAPAKAAGEPPAAAVQPPKTTKPDHADPTNETTKPK